MYRWFPPKKCFWSKKSQIWIDFFWNFFRRGSIHIENMIYIYLSYRKFDSVVVVFCAQYTMVIHMYVHTCSSHIFHVDSIDIVTDSVSDRYSDIITHWLCRERERNSFHIIYLEKEGQRENHCYRERYDRHFKDTRIIIRWAHRSYAASKRVRQHCRTVHNVFRTIIIIT